MKILYYNWDDYLDENNRGGGVTVYQRALITALKSDVAMQVSFLSSGIAYDLRSAPPRWETMTNETDVRRFQIVNSGTQAPAHHSFGDAAQLEHPATEAAFMDFVKKTGPYDVIHFNNLEGLPARVLRLKDQWPDTKVILSLHNHYSVCPQVNLWHQEREVCQDFDDGRKCASCLIHAPNGRAVRRSQALLGGLKRRGLAPNHWLLRQGARLVRRVGKRTKAALPSAKAFVHRRATLIDLINAHCDGVLCVSDAVRSIAVTYGISSTLTRTSYIGTAQARHWNTTQPRPILDPDGTLSLGYLGYMRRDKGFYFLLDALEALPDITTKKLRLVIAARRGDHKTMVRLENLKHRLAGLTYSDGYTHQQLDTILSSVSVGIVPVLWHDNLPQVALEMHARHIPLLTSDLGGAQELGRCPAMTFPAGDIAAFHAKVNALLGGHFDSDAYWQGAMPPVGMRTHIKDLRRHYTGV